MSITKLLIANRGEIACRVIRTARRLGIKTVAVYSAADADALHVTLADEAWCVGPAPARESYLDSGKILDAARAAGADAIHPGYGFLSENADFAQACADAGIIFVGPPASAIRAMGSKSAAKTLMGKSGVPLTPGYHGTSQDAQVLRKAAADIGYPVLIKASAGGGGKGMRVVESAAGLDAAIASAKREAAASFGDDQVLIEKYLTQPRHIEIQIFADTHGEVVSLFERDCSIQRRHQKVIEEAPAPGLDPERRQEMGEAAKAAARAIGYVGAGTVEFIVEGDAFYFMEMNTRLQVEHPVTEMITGQDLVEWQLRVAEGQPLPLRQEDLGITGHAIEVRLYAEDPARDFLPSIGTLVHLRAPAASEHVRVDTGVRAGDRISVHYDPMLAKLIVWDQSREAAVRRLSAALAEYEVVGVQTNRDFLKALVDHPAFAAAQFDTGFIARHADDLFSAPAPAPPAALAAAALQVLQTCRRHTAVVAKGSADPWSPWNDCGAWRMNGAGRQDLVLVEGDAHHDLHIIARAPSTYRLNLADRAFDLTGQVADDGDITVVLDGVRLALRVVAVGSMLHVFSSQGAWVLEHVDPLAAAAGVAVGLDRVIAPMPGRIAQIMVREGDTVEAGAPLLMMEAMKMEYTVAAPRTGRVAEVRYQVDDIVDEGTELVVFTEDAA